MIVCFVPECSEVFIGDGFCDDKYNTISCNFDGGDCCKLQIETSSNQGIAIAHDYLLKCLQCGLLLPTLFLLLF